MCSMLGADAEQRDLAAAAQIDHRVVADDGASSP